MDFSGRCDCRSVSRGRVALASIFSRVADISRFRKILDVPLVRVRVARMAATGREVILVRAVRRFHVVEEARGSLLAGLPPGGPHRFQGASITRGADNGKELYQKINITLPLARSESYMVPG